jgi:hypothetical protein
MKIIKIAQFVKTSQSRLSNLCEVKTNFPDADFWLQRKGSKENVGRPLKEYFPENIGIKVTRTDVLDPNYLYYAMMNLHNQGKFQQMCSGSLNLQHIRVEDVREIGLG